MGKISKYLWFCLLLTVYGCKKPYTPKAIVNPPNYLVVEGTIISGATDSTIIKLSRTVSLSKGTAVNPVTGAIITVQNSSGATVSVLDEPQPGYYAVWGEVLDPSEKYRIQITLADNSVYLSDLETLQTTPPIDSVGFTVQSGGLQLYVNAHDPTNNTRYYRWACEETWKFHAKYYASLITDGASLLPRQPYQQIYYCFAGDVSSTILLGSSAKLAKDIIYKSPLVYIPSTSEKVELRYSILLKQYAVTEDAFRFWTNLKTNTEQLGSIFDAEPSQINGNVHGVSDPKERIFGFVGASTIQTKRIFIDATQLPSNWKPVYPYDCEIDSLWYSAPRSGADQVDQFLTPIGASELALGAFGEPSTLGYLASDHACADCTIRGTTQQPYFWQ